jgi:hypothetical protein
MAIAFAITVHPPQRHIEFLHFPHGALALGILVLRPSGVNLGRDLLDEGLEKFSDAFGGRSITVALRSWIPGFPLS